MITNFTSFMNQVRDICEKTAEEKGYNTTGVDGKNELYQFIQGMTNTDAHALGEIVYKTIRYSRKRDPNDLIKIAAWAYLIYRYGINHTEPEVEPGTLKSLTADEFKKLNQDRHI